ncbi:polysaccharide biosynthesis/export family protein [Pseudacidovorax sp. RU35E]|uniref:polysaccharide biosynthesis/export family protein n=1 Tax=uncultured Pseudacidovorax sp. TaxID=679313 RepID=UPI0009709802|nr:polysaccharide biosynthesis/export family protein [Pseudacidovorax sp. RU35E]
MAAAAALQGCTVIPGPGSVGPYSDQSELPPKFQYVPDEAPEGRITPITTALVRTLQQLTPTGVPSDVRALFGKPDPYTIGPGDVIGVIVYDHPELLPNAGAVITQSVDPTGVSVAPGFIVGANGEISFPYVGRVKIEGMTESEAGDLIARRLARNIQSPQVTVRIQSFRSRRAYVEGQVRTPGSQIFTDLPMTMAEAINRAGGITDAGDRSSIVLTRGGRSVRVDLPALREAGYDLNDIPLRANDTITVGTREDTKVYIMGEVLRPTALALRGSGRLTLNEALGEAGGPTLDTSNPSQIYVIRKGATGSPAIFQLDAKNPAAFALASQFPMRPQDVIYIDPVPLVRWNRVISLILPSAAAVNTGSETIDRARGW